MVVNIVDIISIIVDYLKSHLLIRIHKTHHIIIVQDEFWEILIPFTFKRKNVNEQPPVQQTSAGVPFRGGKRWKPTKEKLGETNYKKWKLKIIAKNE